MSALRQEYMSGGTVGAMGTTGRYDGPPLIGNQKAYYARKQKEFERSKVDYSSDVQSLAELLRQKINALGSSENAGDQQLAEVYANYLQSLSDPKGGRKMAMSDYLAGRIPGISKPQQARMPPAWS